MRGSSQQLSTGTCLQCSLGTWLHSCLGTYLHCSWFVVQHSFLGTFLHSLLGTVQHFFTSWHFLMGTLAQWVSGTWWHSSSSWFLCFLRPRRPSRPRSPSFFFFLRARGARSRGAGPGSRKGSRAPPPRILRRLLLDFPPFLPRADGSVLGHTVLRVMISLASSIPLVNTRRAIAGSILGDFIAVGLRHLVALFLFFLVLELLQTEETEQT